MAEKFTKQKQNPRKYEKNNSVVLKDTAEFVPKLLEIMGTKAGGNKVFLDYGCGSGSTCWRYLIWQAELTKSTIYGVDISEDMIEYAREHFPHPRMKYFAGDILSDEWPLKDFHFDGVLAIYSMTWVKDYKLALERFHKQLKPNGKLGIMLPDECELFGMLMRLKEDSFWSDYAEDIYYPEYAAKRIAATKVYLPHLESLGFKIHKTKVHHRAYPYKKLRTSADFFISINPFAEQLTPELQTELQKWYIEDMSKWPQPENKKEVADHSGNLGNRPFTLLYNSIIIIAEKV